MDVAYRRCRLFSHMYFICSIVSLLAFKHPLTGLILPYFAPITLTHPMLFGMIVNVAEWVLQSIALLSLIALVISYIFALKKRFVPLATYIIIDIGLTVCCFIFYAFSDFTDLLFFLFRLPFSFLITMVFLREVYLIRYYKKAEKQMEDAI